MWRGWADRAAEFKGVLDKLPSFECQMGPLGVCVCVCVCVCARACVCVCARVCAHECVW